VSEKERIMAAKPNGKESTADFMDHDSEERERGQSKSGREGEERRGNEKGNIGRSGKLCVKGQA
jgi:hypothetical protein